MNDYWFPFDSTTEQTIGLVRESNWDEKMTEIPRERMKTIRTWCHCLCMGSFKVNRCRSGTISRGLVFFSTHRHLRRCFPVHLEDKSSISIEQKITSSSFACLIFFSWLVIDKLPRLFRLGHLNSWSKSLWEDKFDCLDVPRRLNVERIDHWKASPVKIFCHLAFEWMSLERSNQVELRNANSHSDRTFLR